MLRTILIIGTAALLTVVAAEAQCAGKTEANMQRPRCTNIKGLNNVNTSDECAAACCAHTASNPYASDGCTAWSLNGWSQCFLCTDAGNQTVEPAPTKCSAKTNCSTGLITQPPPPPLPPAPQTGKLGGEASVEYVDYGRLLRWPSYLNGTAFAQSDLTPEGWPTTDCSICVFDGRPIGAWAPPMDDPETRQADLSGVWTLKITGKAESITLGDPAIKGITLGASSYDAGSNIQTTPITIAKGKYPEVVNLVVLTFAGTQANASAGNNTGFRGLQLIKPEYTSKPDQLFTDDWAALMAPFDHLRWMGALGTNSYSFLCGGDNAPGCSVIRWEDRALPSYAFSDPKLCKGCHGLSWEYVLLAANEAHKDLWINVPITASAPTVCRTAPTTSGGDPRKCLDTDPTLTYEYQLALFLKNGNEFTNNTGLHPDLNIYIEHSNEVWNFGFPQYALNKAMAEWEVLNVSTKKSNLANPVRGRPDINCTGNAECWAHRRHARRVYEISQTFQKVFGAGSINKRIRPVYASWTIQLQEYYNNTLAWLEAEYGPPSNYMYALANAQYFGPQAQDAHGKMGEFNYSTATIPEVIQAFHDGADANVEMTYDFVQFAKTLNLKVAGYESGPGYAVGGQKPGSKGLNTLIEASRDPGMKNVVEYDVRETCWRHGWDIYNYFAIEGVVSRYGCWGATETWKDRNPGPPKLQAIYELTGTKPDEIEAWAFNPARPRAFEASRLQ